MDIQAEKLELRRLLLNTDSETTLSTVKALLVKYAKQDETEYLLSSQANSKHLEQSISELNHGNKRAIQTKGLWR